MSLFSLLHVTKSRRDESVASDQLMPATDELGIVERSSRVVRFGCGHPYDHRFKVNFYGRIHAPDRGQLAARVMCGDCMLNLVKKYFRRCGYCRHVIKVDDPVSLFPIDSEEALKNPDVVVVETIDHHARYLMGCMDPVCVKSNRTFSGYWRKDGLTYVYLNDSASSGGVASGLTPVNVIIGATHCEHSMAPIAYSGHVTG